jgi:hypothetical protein
MDVCIMYRVPASQEGRNWLESFLESDDKEKGVVFGTTNRPSVDPGERDVWVYLAHAGQVLGRARMTALQVYDEVEVGGKREVRRSRCLGVLNLPAEAPPGGKPLGTPLADGPRWVWKYLEGHLWPK